MKAFLMASAALFATVIPAHAQILGGGGGLDRRRTRLADGHRDLDHPRRHARLGRH
jgi:hypothetical protein